MKYAVEMLVKNIIYLLKLYWRKFKLEQAKKSLAKKQRKANESVSKADDAVRNFEQSYILYERTKKKSK